MALRAVPDHPKFARLKRMLGLSKCPCLGYLEGLWHFAGRFTPHGNLGKYPDEEIEGWLEWDGEPGALIAALMACKWIDADPVHRLVVHDWHQHSDDATKKAVSRSKKPFVAMAAGQQGDTVPQSSSMSGQCRDTGVESAELSILPEPEPEPGPVPVPAPVPKTLALTALAVPAAAPFLTLPLNDHSEFAITEEKVLEWEELYRAIDVRAEIRAYKGWALNNPTKRKTRKGILASVNTWMARSQDRGGNTNRNGGGNANRSQQRTDGNIEAFNRAFEQDQKRVGLPGGVSSSLH